MTEKDFVDFRRKYITDEGNLSRSILSKDANKKVGATAARLARAEGMEAHARTGDIRLKKYGHSN